MELNVVTFAPAVARQSQIDDNYPLCVDEQGLKETISSFSWSSPSYYEKLVSVLQAVSTIRKGKKKREILNPPPNLVAQKFVQ